MTLFKKYKLQKSLVLIISTLMLLLIVLQDIVLYSTVSRLVSSKVSDESKVMTEQINERINEKLMSIKQLAAYISINNDINNIIINAPNMDDYEQISSLDQISKTLSNITNSRNDISEIIIVTDRMRLYNYSNANGIYQYERIKAKEYWKYMHEKNEGFIPTRKNDIDSNNKNVNIITYFKKILSNNGDELGIICIDINESIFKNIIKSNKSDDTIFIIDERNNILVPFYDKTDLRNQLFKEYSNNLDVINVGTGYEIVKISRNKYLNISSKVNDFGWNVVILKPYDEILRGIYEILVKITTVGIICFLIAVVLLIYISRKIFMPIKILIKNMNRVGEGNFDIDIDTSYKNEIGELNNRFKVMTEKIKELLLKVEIEQDKKREAELNALQSQINPHFLYNTLDSINWMAIKNKSEDISEMVTNLAMLFRLSLNGGNDITSIEYEIQHIRCYLKIQEYRYNHRFNYVEAFDDEILQYKTIKLILQPLVENCIVHGFENSRGGGEIILTASIQNKDIVFEIEDNGVGVNADFMNECLKAKISMTKGYGLRNVDERIKMRFGETYGLKYINIEKGTKVEVKIPALKLGEELNNV